MKVTGSGSAPTSASPGSGSPAGVTITPGAPPVGSAPPSSVAAALPAAAAAASGTSRPFAPDVGAPDLLPAAAAEGSPEAVAQAAAQEIKLKFGGRELSPTEAQAEYDKLMNRLQGADRTTAAYRSRAEQAVQAAHALQDILRNAGMLSEDGQFLIKSPEQIRAGLTGEPEEEEYKFELPSFLKISDDPAVTDALFGHMEQVAQEKGLRYAFALLTDHMDQVMGQFWERLAGEKGYLPRQFDSKLAGMQPFFQHLEHTGARTKFLSQMQQRIDDSGQPAYPELRDAALIPRLVYIMDRQPEEWRHTEDGFESAIYHLRGQLAYEARTQALQPGEGSGAGAPTVPPRTAARPPSVVVLDQGAPSGIPRPRPGNAAPADDGSRLLTRRGVAGGINWT